ncbi:arsenosugar biosynthesis radical SAM (seleno)protein ArsS [Pseudobacteriovorax antillogorgiicola]|uniref:Radical SAM/Cys-rich domain-containing protein n=1 Tax=Pseudobacteriovorax antillogorgiicola TaxID=1513793 RepID=A0A1Y6CMK5_9BACT|nr:arsenosugar biosynthesis radical SAM (seleno)protein ArsS [Pseudobacteriovorax antillogorgiicola]TCS47321.1 radical SAM/Cys-rich protein [Pseudobacteriovorax antillogorgiicola]SMF62823.1 radical SAM/Cys-rich domain-containing protein [Pseudobacteriovorax antillogorgiicola]
MAQNAKSIVIEKASPEIENRFGFAKKIVSSGLDLKARTIETLQINITKLCNQACVHCHVDSSPRRREAMSDAVIDQIIKVLESNPSIKALDITGGAPELHPRFKELVTKARQLEKTVIVRHNLTVTHDPHPQTKESLADLPDFFAEQEVEIVSSLPYYQEFFTDKQRGSGVFKKSILSLQMLNERGYGIPDSNKILNLVYNPVGAFLPPPQKSLEASYKKELKEKFDISFNHLFAITNMPIHRFKAQLRRLKSYEDYMEKLVSAFNPAAAEDVMCRSLVSVSFDGKIYDCDFNQVLDMEIDSPNGAMTIFDWNTETLAQRTIRTADHCFGCTAGAGSSCGGNTTS